MSNYAKGIPSKKDFGDLSQIEAGQLLTYILQHHDAIRAGKHHDLRFGDKSKGLYSWAVPKGPPKPGDRLRLAVRQPVHSYKYKDFEGSIPAGQYGGGTVRKEDEGEVLITKADDRGIHFTLAHRRHPERFVLARPKKGRDWLLINTTITDKVDIPKLKYKKIEPDQINAIVSKLKSGNAQAKIDGASTLIHLMKDGAEYLSYRTSKDTDRPIVHTERILKGRQHQQVDPEDVGSVLRGELYGEGPRGVLSPAELTALLNSSVGKSIKDQNKDKSNLKTLIFDIERMGDNLIDKNKIPYTTRLELAKSLANKYLRPGTFEFPDIHELRESENLFEQVRSGNHHKTQEGIIITPERGTPYKVKNLPEHDVFITGTFPGKGKYKHSIGGLTYGLDPGGKTVGRIGTGFSDRLRSQIYDDPESVVGRVARIRAQEQLPSGAYRVPSFISLHEDI